MVKLNGKVMKFLFARKLNFVVISQLVKKGDILTNITIETMAAEGKCLSRIDGKVAFIEGGAPGDVVDVQLTKVKANFLEARVAVIHHLSEHRAQPFCEHFGLCGGCVWQHIQYAQQLKYKQQQVVDNLERIGGLQLPAIQPIVPSHHTKYYRNKLDYTFTANRWLTHQELSFAIENKTYEVGLGYHIPKMYDRVFDVKQCHLQPDPSNAIRLLVKEVATQHDIPFFDLRKQIGFLRTLTIRSTMTGSSAGALAKAGELMVILQVTYDKMEWTERILSAISENFPQVTSVNYIINGKRNDTFADLDVICWRGNPYVTESMPLPIGDGELQFRVGPKSFYQTNPSQAFELYKIVWKMAALTGSELVYDLYTGTGTIANFVARDAAKVVGLEYVAAAIEDAKVNSQINHIGNTHFFAGDIKDLLKESFIRENGKPDVVITDPPRAGMHEDVTNMLLQVAPGRIVYVSCNPATQARDLKILAEKYAILEVQPVDMFPHTIHVENVVHLALR